MPVGALNWPLPVPRCPTLVTKVPEELNFSTRLAELVDDVDVARGVDGDAAGAPVRNWPLPVPRAPNLATKVPVELNFWTRLLPESVT